MMEREACCLSGQRGYMAFKEGEAHAGGLSCFLEHRGDACLV